MFVEVYKEFYNVINSNNIGSKVIEAFEINGQFLFHV